MPQSIHRKSPRRMTVLMGGVMAIATLAGCAQGGVAPSVPAEARQVAAAYGQIQGTSLESEEQRLQLLKSLADSPSPSDDAFLFQALGASEAPFAPDAKADAAPKLALWSEFLPYERVIEHLPALKARGISLLVAVTPKKAEEPGLLELLRQAKAQGVEVRPWLLIAEEHGYWANKWNYREVTRFVGELIGKLKAQDLLPSTVALDIEPPVSLTQPLAARLERVDLLGARKLLVKSSENGSLLEARQAFQQLVADLHAQGIQVHAVTTPMLLDDMAVGQGRLQSALGIPVEGVAWDQVTCMVYRTEFLRLAGKMGGDIVYRYAQDAKRFFGARAGLDLGVIGAPGFGSPAMGYTDPADLKTDMNAASQAGIGRINVFSLDGILEQGGLERWLTPPESRPVKREAKALLLRTMIQTIARSLPPAK